MSASFKKYLAGLLLRLKKPSFILAAAGIVYQVWSKFGSAPEFGAYQTAVDLVSYALIGTGVYSTFHPDEQAK